MKEYELKITATRMKGFTKDNKAYDFIAFKSYDLKGNKCDIIFNKECPNVPTKEGVYYLKVASNKIYLDNRKQFYTYRIKEFIECIAYDSHLEETYNDDLPF